MLSSVTSPSTVAAKDPPTVGSPSKEAAILSPASAATHSISGGGGGGPTGGNGACFSVNGNDADSDRVPGSPATPIPAAPATARTTPSGAAAMMYEGRGLSGSGGAVSDGGDGGGGKCGGARSASAPVAEGDSVEAGGGGRGRGEQLNTQLSLDLEELGGTTESLADCMRRFLPVALLNLT